MPGLVIFDQVLGGRHLHRRVAEQGVRVKVPNIASELLQR